MHEVDCSQRLASCFIHGGFVHAFTVTVHSTVLTGQKLGLREVDEGIWLFSFMRYDLGFIDLEQQTLQPVDNPSAPRLLPKS